MIRIGIIGFGLMGRTHAASYARSGRAVITAIAEPQLERLSEPVLVGNIEGQGEARFDPTAVAHFNDPESLLASGAVDAVSICSPTPDHVAQTIAALQAGKHVLVEKPLAVTAERARAAVEAAARHGDLVTMPAMCMRFWPAWAWLRAVIRDRTYGRVCSATFTRLGSMPSWAAFYQDAALSGGAILDLHIHDADFIRFCFGEPRAVEAIGYPATTVDVDHVSARYRFTDGPAIVTAEGGWCMAQGFPFTMRYTVNFEHASADFDLARGRLGGSELMLAREGRIETVELSPDSGYQHEVRHFLDCIDRRRPSDVVTMEDARRSVLLVEAERRSVRQGGIAVEFDPEGG